MSGSGELFHGTAVAIDGKAALIVGASGSGKSDLALRLMSSPLSLFDKVYETQLVGDDQVLVNVENERLIVSPHENLAGLIEVRGLGIMSVPHVAKAELCLVVTLVDREKVTRLPETPFPETEILTCSLPGISLYAFDLSAPQKLALGLLETAKIRGKILADR